MSKKEGLPREGNNTVRTGRILHSNMVSRIRHLRRARFAEIAGGEPCECGTCQEGLAGVSQGLTARPKIQRPEVVPGAGADKEETVAPSRADALEFIESKGHGLR